MPDFTLPLDELPDPLPIPPAEAALDVALSPPGSKSITNRAYMLAALADGPSRIARPLRSDDCDGLLDALCTLGAAARWDGDDVEITGVGGRFPEGGTVNLGDGGTPTRFMIAAACLAAAPVVVDGSPRMRERPIAEGVQMLRHLGACIEYVEAEGRLPVRVAPGPDLRGGFVPVGEVASSQFISALQLIAPFLPAGAGSELPETLPSRPYVTLTEEVLGAWGIGVQGDRVGGDRSGRRVQWSVTPAGTVRGRHFAIEPDASSAVYWAAAATFRPGARWRSAGLSLQSFQPDISAMRFFAGAGASVEAVDDGMSVQGPERLAPTSQWSCLEWPDGALCAACVAAMLPGPTRLHGLRTLRVKETDRIAALARELGKIGCTVVATDDALTVDPSSRHDEPVVIETYGDHRMAMAFAVLGLVRPGLSIRNPACVAKSYPGFWSDFAAFVR